MGDRTGLLGQVQHGWWGEDAGSTVQCCTGRRAAWLLVGYSGTGAQLELSPGRGTEAVGRGRRFSPVRTASLRVEPDFKCPRRGKSALLDHRAFWKVVWEWGDETGMGGGVVMGRRPPG